MYRFLEARIVFHGYSKKEFAESINMNYNTLLAKLNGKSKFTLDEAVQIKEFLQEDMSIEQLFEEK